MGQLFLFTLAPITALLASCLISFSFVGSLYIWKLLGYKDLNRDQTATIQRRFVSACLTCLWGIALIGFFARPLGAGENNGITFAQLYGFDIFTLETLRACLRCLGLTAILFVGPIVQHFIAVVTDSADLFSLPGGRWVALRNYLFAPFTEEFVFRACVIRLLLGGGFSPTPVIFLSPFYFAMAHTHHYIEHLRRSNSKKQARTQVAFQVFYTSLFGMYSNFLLVRSGSTLAVIVAHSFRNHQGFPDVGFFAPRHSLHAYRVPLAVVYLSGIVAFCCMMGPLTAGFNSTFNVIAE